MLTHLTFVRYGDIINVSNALPSYCGACCTLFSASSTMGIFKESSFICCSVQVGFLYLRYVGNPRTLWEWIQPYVRDSEVGFHLWVFYFCFLSCTVQLSYCSRHFQSHAKAKQSAVPCFCVQEIQPSPEGHGKTVTMGEFVRDVFLEQVRAWMMHVVRCNPTTVQLLLMGM
jgi:hypothetical protein